MSCEDLRLPSLGGATRCTGGRGEELREMGAEESTVQGEHGNISGRAIERGSESETKDTTRTQNKCTDTGQKENQIREFNRQSQSQNQSQNQN